MRKQLMSRRAFLGRSGIGAALLLGGGYHPFGQTTGLLKLLESQPTAGQPFTTQPQMMEPFVPDAEVAVTAVEKYVQILPGAQTRVWGYEGELVSDNTGNVTVQSIPGSYLGPILRVPRGTKLRFVFHNNLAENSVVHPHGLNVPEDCDGQPMQAIGPGENKVYDFQVIDRACPAWFHPHPMMRTAEQVAMGLAGLFYVTDEAEAQAVPGAATGANDVPLVLQDRLFDSNNQFVYQPNIMWGYLGDRILVNGKLNTVLSLEPRAYRLRVLNGSNARTFKLAWSNNMALKVIGTDGGLLPAVVSKSYVTLMPGERVDLWVDFSSLAGKPVTLRSLSFSAGSGMGGGGGGMGSGGMDSGSMGGGGMGGGGCNCGGGGMGSSLANGAAFNILTVNVSRKATVKPVLGPLPPLEERFDASNVMNFNTPVPFTLAMQRMVWTINGRVYEDMVAAEDEMVYRDVPIAWEWINNSPIPHPMHLHNVQFQVVSARLPQPAATARSTRVLSTVAGKTPSSSGRASGSRSPCALARIRACICITATSWNTRIWA